jgi:hypothetical protein
VRKTVTKEFREKVRAKYKGLDNNPAYWSLIRELIFKNNTYGSHGLILLQHEKLAGFNKKHPSNFNSGKFLQAFKHDVLSGFEYSDYQALDKCRTVVNTGIDAEVYDWVKEMGDKREVFFETGWKVNGKSIQACYQEDLEAIESVKHLIHCEEARYIENYHNSKTTHKFSSKVRANYNEASRLIETYRVTNEEDLYIVQKEVLRDIVNYPMPLLRPTYKADRLFSYGSSLTTIKSEVRKVLTKGWTEIDLKNAQLSIIAKLWDIPSLQDYLATGQSIWQYFYSALEIDKNYKPALKTFVYSIAYGAGEDTLKKDFEQSCRNEGLALDNGLVKKLFSLPLITNILQAQKKRLEAVKGKDIYTPLGKIRSKKPTAKLALEAQAYEMLLIYEIYKLAETTDKFEIMLYQFDGVSIDFRDERSKGYWIEKIKSAVEAKAKEFDFMTTVEFTEL